jgi:hypothetical protein
VGVRIGLVDGVTGGLGAEWLVVAVVMEEASLAEWVEDARERECAEDELEMERAMMRSRCGVET